MSRRNFSFGGDDAWGARKRGGDDFELDITPMIDVTFLLLIFFMVASTMQPSAGATTPAAVHGDRVDSSYTVTFFVTAPSSPGETPIIRDVENNPRTVEEVAVAVRQAVEAGKERLVLHSDGRVPAGFVIDVFNSVARLLEEGDVSVPQVEYRIGVREKR